MGSGFTNDAREVFRLDVSVAVLVEEVEGLPDALSLQSSKHLRKLRVCHAVSVSFPAGIERCPVRVPVEWNGILGAVAGVCLFEGVEVDEPGGGVGEETESDLVLGVWLGQEVVEGAPIGEGDATSLAAVCNGEQNSIVLALDLVLQVVLLVRCGRFVERAVR